MPGDEDPLPPDNGNPHPHVGPIFPGEPAQVAPWADNQMQLHQHNEDDAHNEEHDGDSDVSSDHHFVPPAGNIEEIEVPMMQIPNPAMDNNVNQDQMVNVIAEPGKHPAQDSVQNTT